MLKHNLLLHGSEHQTSEFGEPRDNGPHKGTDWVSHAGLSGPDKIVAPFPGKVIELRNDIPGISTKNPTGNYVIRDLGWGFIDRMYHMKAQSIQVYVGQQLNEKDIIGTMGYTGHCIPPNVNGTHLHYELRKNNVPIDPLPYLMGLKFIGPAPTIPTQPIVQPAKLSNTEIALQILDQPNKWGNGTERINKLKKEGYDPTAVQAEVNRIIRERTAQTPVKTIVIGSQVKLKPGCSDYNGRRLLSFLFNRTYNVSQVSGDRVVITFNGTTVAAIKKSDLILIS